jgi:hypothetical protein
LPSKNASQLEVISALASPEAPAVLPAEGELPLAAGDEATEDDGGALDGEAVEDEPELLQAAIVAASARPSAGAAIRRASRLSRMTRLRRLGRMNW